jgi:flavorubredoxin/rubredoxin
MKITNDIRYIGVNDHEIDLFEGQYDVPNGMAYNSYVIVDEKIAVMDTVDFRFGHQWLANIANELDGRTPDYLIVQHMEPDHSSNIIRFLTAYPRAIVVSSAKAFTMMKNFYRLDLSNRCIVVGEGSTLSLGEHTLTFVTVPMVHWPEVIVTYDSTDKVLFSADGFGKFGALDVEEEWACEARRYYIGIVGKYGAQVQNLLKKASALDIQTICPLHGPVLTENLGYYIDLYDTWSSYRPEEKGVVIAYTSVYGNTKEAVRYLADELKAAGCEKVVLNDLARCDMAEAVEDAFRYDRLVLATTTYNADIFPFMREFIDHLTERNFQNRTVAFIENGSWAPMAAKVMRGMLEKSKNLAFADTTVTILSALNEKSSEQVVTLAKELCEQKTEEIVEEASAGDLKKFACKICGYVHEAESLPEDFVCPLCKRPASFFEEVK